MRREPRHLIDHTYAYTTIKLGYSEILLDKANPERYHDLKIEIDALSKVNAGLEVADFRLTERILGCGEKRTSCMEGRRRTRDPFYQRQDICSDIRV